MQKQLIAYSTTTGGLLAASQRAKASVLLCQGSGVMDAGVVTCAALNGVLTEQIVQLVVASAERCFAYSRLVRLSDTTVDTGHKLFSSSPVDVAVEALGLRDADQFSDVEMAQFLSDTKALHGNDVAVLRIQSNSIFDPHTFEVELVSKRLVRKIEVEYDE